MFRCNELPDPFRIAFDAPVCPLDDLHILAVFMSLGSWSRLSTRDLDLMNTFPQCMQTQMKFCSAVSRLFSQTKICCPGEISAWRVVNEVLQR
jgi:hypothetical protein